MAKAARIDNVILHPDGRVEILKTEGDTPLPEAPSGSGFIYPDRAALHPQRPVISASQAQTEAA